MSFLSRVNTKALDALLTIAAVLMVTGPLLFTNSSFAVDFANHLWLTWVAGKTLLQAGHPSFFLNAPGMGVFYPFFAFYGGTLYFITGAVSALLGGHAVIAFVGVTTLVVAGTYGGMLWLGRQLGLNGLSAHAPALVVVTSAYYITNLYGRGAWPEFVAVAVIPPLLASGLHLARASSWRPWPVCVFVLSAVIFTGSHNITLTWGVTMIIVTLLVAWLTLEKRGRMPYRRLAYLAGLAALSVLVNAWFLVPDVLYQGNVVAHNNSTFNWNATSYLNTPSLILDPFRHVPAQSSTPSLFVQAPDWFLAWGLVVGAFLLWRRPVARSIRRPWIGAIAVVILLLAMMMLKPAWSIIPFPLNEIQFPYRLGSYLFYSVAALVLLTALALQRTGVVKPRWSAVGGARAALLPVCAVSVALCLWQLWATNSLYPHYFANRSAALTGINAPPVTWYDDGSYRDIQSPVVPVPGNRLLVIEPNLIHGDRFAAWMNVPPGREPIQTDIGGGPYLVHLSGLEQVGRDPIGYTVVRRPIGSTGPVHVVLETASSPAIVIGRIVSVLAIIAICVLLVFTAVRARRIRVSRAIAPSSDGGPGATRAPLG